MKTLFEFAGRKKRFAWGALAVGISVAISPANGGVLKEARVTQVIKDVKLLPGQAAPRAAAVSDNVSGDTAVRTGADSRAELTFTDLTIARLGANTIFSFNEGTRTISLTNGAILLRVPKDSGGAKIQTAAVTAAITGTTVMAEYHPKGYAKYIVLEGQMRIYLKGRLGESILMGPGQMMMIKPDATRLSDPVDVDLKRLIETSLFFQGFRPLGSEPLLADAQHVQLEKKAAGELIDTNLVIFGRGTLVTLTDPQSLDVIDRKIAATTLPVVLPVKPTPTPTPTATPTATPTPSPSATPTPSPSATPTPSPSATPTPSPSPSATPTPSPSATPTPSPSPSATPTPSPSATPSPTPQPTPSKFGTPPVIVSSVPYVLDNSTQIQTDPTITKGATVDLGKIYRDAAQDGPFSTWAFTATSAFDTTSGVNGFYGPNVPVAAFKFAALQLSGNPIILIPTGGALNLALISVGPISSAPSGDTTFTFLGMQSVLIATQLGSIDISGPDFVFRGIPSLYFYARGTGSNLTLGGMGIFNVGTLRLVAENNIQINAPEDLRAGASGGSLLGTAGAAFTVSSPITATTAFINPAAGFSGAGGNVSLTALGGALTLNSLIQVSSNDPDGAQVQRSASGGTISLFSNLTSGTGITLSSTARLLSLLNDLAPGPAGTITLTTAGSDIVSQGAALEADRGTISLSQTAAPPIGTAQITINGGSLLSETLLASSRGDLNIGTTTAVNLSAVTLSLLATNNISWSGGTLVAAASASSGNAIVQAGNDISIANPLDLERFSSGTTNGLDLRLDAGRNLQASQGLTLGTDGSGLTTGGNITLRSGASMTIGGAATLQTGPATANQTTGSNIDLSAGGPITFSDLLATVQIGAGRTLANGGQITLTGMSSYLATLGDGGLSLQIINSAGGGIITTGGNIVLTLNGNLTTGASGLFNLRIDNSNAGRIPTGANITSSVGGNLNANQVNVSINNLARGFIGTGANINFTVSGTTTTSNDANFTLLNSLPGTSGTIASDAIIKVTLADANIGGSLNAFIDNTDGSIGGTGGQVTLQLNGKLAVTGRLNVFGTLNSNSTVTAGTLSVTNLITPATVTAMAGGITRFSFPNDITINPLHTLTVGALKSSGGINFNGPDEGTPAGFGPFDGGQLTINVPTSSFGPSAADDIQGAITLNGGTSFSNRTAGNGGTLNVNATGNINVNSNIDATSGLQPAANTPSGNGGNVNLNTTGGTVTVNSRVQVSSADTTAGAVPPPRRRSRAGGNINLQSGAATGVAINVSNTGQLLSLLDAAATGPTGKITILATGASSSINITGSAAALAPGPDSIRADRGSIDIRHTGDRGQISITNSNIRADIVKVGALGSSGVLNIGGGTISADTTLKLYAAGANGSVNFISNVTLGGNSVKTIAGNSVTVFNNVVVTIGGGKPADVYVLDRTQANYAGFNGGNNSTNGMFIIEGGAGASPTSGAVTHLGVAPPAFGPPGGP
ncbi:MAG: hypothetical protein QOD12_725 [Verrucomicrobiota bacterium]|jgi:outer membrane biosynthesis protein TonB